jgi:hypothetical protein
MIKDFQFIKDFAELDTYIGYAIWELGGNFETSSFIIFKFLIDAKIPNEIEVEAEFILPEDGSAIDLGQTKIIIDLFTCSEGDFIKKLQQSVKIIGTKSKELKDIYEDLILRFDVKDISKFYSEMLYLFKENQ